MAIGEDGKEIPTVVTPPVGSTTKPTTGADAENAIHAGINQAYFQDAGERLTWETDPFFHPLQATWVKDMTLTPDQNEKNLWCWRDCQERDRIRKLECDEVRRRVESKLKELGCPTTLIPNDLPSPCGGDPAAATAAPAAQPQYAPMPMYYYPQQYQGYQG